MANDGTVKIGTELDDSGFKSGISKLGNVASKALKGGVAVIGSVATAASGAVTGLLALESATEEYRVAQGKLNTAFEAAGYGPEAAAQAYNDFYAILGDTDTATEASQLLAKLADNQEDLSSWTRIAAGVNGTFGDSLPIEGLIEAANETAKVGTVTGTLADALNWAGISEDEFNEKLAACTDESERNQLIMDTLAATYDEASDAFYRNNEALVASREAQAQMDSALSELGQAVSDVKTRMIGEFLPAVAQVTTGLAGMLSGTEGAEEQFSEGIDSLINAAVSKLPEFLDFGAQILSSVLSGIIQSAPKIAEAIPGVIGDIGEAIGNSLGFDVDSSELESSITSLASLFYDLLPAITGVTAAFVAFKTAMMIASIIQGVSSAITAFKVANEGATIAQAALNAVMNANPFVLIATLIAGVVTALMTLWATNEDFRNAVITVWNAVKKSISSAVSIIKTFFLETIPNAGKTALDWFLSIPEKMKEIGSNIVRGLWDGILSMADWIKSKISGFFGNLLGGIKGLLGIHSPSTVFREQVGKNIGLGVAEGIEDSISSAQAAAKKLSNSIPAATIGVQYANASMMPASATTPRFSTESALSNVAGMLALASANSSNKEIVMQVNGREFARLLVPDIRAVQSQSPQIVYG